MHHWADYLPPLTLSQADLLLSRDHIVPALKAWNDLWHDPEQITDDVQTVKPRNAVSVRSSTSAMTFAGSEMLELPNPYRPTTNPNLSDVRSPVWSSTRKARLYPDEMAMLLTMGWVPRPADKFESQWGFSVSQFDEKGGATKSNGSKCRLTRLNA